MQSTLVKVLDEKVDVSTLTHDSIAELVQTTRTVDRFKNTIRVPFELRAKQQGPGTIYDNAGVNISVVDEAAMSKLTAKERFNHLGTYLATCNENSRSGKQMYGVKKFGHVLAVDAAHLADQIASWESYRYKDKPDLKVTDPTGSGVEHMAREFTPGLISPSMLPNMATAPIDSASVVGTYVAAIDHERRVKDQIITPFTDAFKANALQDKNQTVTSMIEFGDLRVQVMNVPRSTTLYARGLADLADEIREHAGRTEGSTDGSVTHWNDDLIVPRTYVAIDHLLGNIREARANTSTTIQPRINILYVPAQATVLSFD